MTAIAVAPVAAVWLVSQGPYSYFFPRYLLFTVGAWAILAGIGLSRLDARIATAAVLVIAILAAGDQQAVTPAQATLLQAGYRLSIVKHVQSLTVFLLTRAPTPARR